MRTTLQLDETLYREAAKAAGVEEKTKLVHLGWEALIRETAGRRLAKLYGTLREAKVPRRRKT